MSSDKPLTDEEDDETTTDEFIDSMLDNPEFVRSYIATRNEQMAKLIAENTALREIAQAVTDMPNVLANGSYPFCAACQRYADDHAPDCAKEKARALLKAGRQS